MSNLPYKRADRVAHLIHQVLAEALTNDLADPGLAGVTIMRVRLTADMGIARIYYAFSPYSSEKEVEVYKAWRRATSYLRKLVGSKVRLRVTPRLEFFYDDTLDIEERIEKLLGGIDA